MTLWIWLISTHIWSPLEASTFRFNRLFKQMCYTRIANRNKCYLVGHWCHVFVTASGPARHLDELYNCCGANLQIVLQSVIFNITSIKWEHPTPLKQTPTESVFWIISFCNIRVVWRIHLFLNNRPILVFLTYQSRVQVVWRIPESCDDTLLKFMT